MSSKRRGFDWNGRCRETLMKMEYAREFFKTIQNGKRNKDVLDEILYQIEICADLGIHLTETDIENLCYCTSAIGVENRARVLKFAS